MASGAKPAERVRFGVLAPTSTVARLAVVPAILASDTAELGAVASLSAAAGSVPVVPGDVPWRRRYEDLLGDDRLEAVYVPLPNSMHREWVERAADAGKHVLCEKPLSVSAGDARAMVDYCADRGVVLMEAYMTPFHPRSRALVELVRSGGLGEFLFGFAAFTGSLSRPDDHRWRPEMGGGALLDVGIYCLAPLLESAGGRAVTGVRGVARLGGHGVDASFSGFLALEGGTSASFQCSFEAPERQVLEIVGTDGAALLERAFTPSHDDTVVFVRRRDGGCQEIETQGGDPYLGMVDHFCDVVRDRAVPERPAEASVALAALVERLKAAAVLPGAEPASRMER